MRKHRIKQVLSEYKDYKIIFKNSYEKGTKLKYLL